MDVIKSLNLIGSYFDVQLNGDNLITWDVNGDVKCYSFSSLLYHFERERVYSISEKSLDKRIEWRSKTVGGLFPTDTVVMGGVVYTASETGFYEGMRIYKARKKYAEGQVRKLWDGIPTSLRRGFYNRISISAGEEGLYEYDKTFLELDGDVKEIERNLYCVSQKHSYESRYLRNTILSLDEYDNVGFCVFYQDKKLGFRKKLSFVELNDTIDQKIEVVTSIGSKDVFYRREENKILSYSLSKNSKFITRNIFKDNIRKEYTLIHHYTPFGVISESDNLFKIRFNNDVQSLHSFRQAVVRWRLFKNVFETKFCLIIVFENKIQILLIQ